MEENNVLDLSKVMKEQKQSMNRKKREQRALDRANGKKSIKRKVQFIAFLLLATTLLTYWFRANYRLQVPFTIAGRDFIVALNSEKPFLSPVAEAKEQPEKVLTDMETIEKYKYSVLMKGMYRKESSAGKNDYCKEKGEFNGFGYAQNSRENRCYKTFDDVAERVNDWLDVELAQRGNDVVSTLCYYNTGRDLATCDYATEVLGFMIEYL